MKLFYPLITCLLIALSACNSNNKRAAESTPSSSAPVAFQDEQKDYSLVKKRSYNDDIVEELYKELLDKNKPLSDLEDGIEKLKDNSHDSAAGFNTFDTRNNSYYNSTATHLGLIKDSVLKEKIKQLIDNSLLKYKSKIASHNNLLSTINGKDLTLNDLHIVLKLTKTLAMMEKYQSAEMPSVKPLEDINKAYDKIIYQTDSLTRH